MILAAGSAPTMTMSQILKQTKKCCSKIIRKLSFHPNGVNGPSSSSSCGVGSNNGGTGAHGRSISLNNRATTKYVLHKNCTPTRCKVQPTSPERFGAGPSWMSEDDSPVRRRLDLSPSANEQPDIPATQNNYRVSRDGKNLPKKRTNITSNKNVNLRKCFRMRKGFKEELGEEELNNSASVASSKLDKISKTLYHGAGGSGAVEHRDGEVIYTHEGKLINLANNLASQASEKSKISKPLFLSGKHKNYNQIETEFGAELDYDDGDDDELVACEVDAIRTAADGSRLQFELSQPLPEAHVSPLPGRSHYEDIVFEKVKFDHSKRYLRTGSPSTASNRSHPGVVQSADSILSINQLANKSDDFVDPWRNYNVSNANTRWNKVAKNPWEIEAQKVDSPTPTSPLRPSWNPFSEEEPEAIPPPKVYPPPYQVRTDIWQNLNNKNYEIDSDVVWRTSSSNSRRTSASTVETWIEDEVFDNSFNEELERRCATLQI
ncbi:hypothetical protein pipiens_016902 [Culex pipiens pipiens]|uniref:Uncharacterized protein n=1 Tax=Culex pipiens pipiens TaxID=38569 RepID=A0ABD1CJ61_CULPP